MNLQDASKFRKIEDKRPAGVIMAFEYPQVLNEVILYEKWWFRILKQLTREEFMEQLRYNATRPDFTRGSTVVEDCRINLDAAVDVEEPGQEYKYFYSLELES